MVSGYVHVDPMVQLEQWLKNEIQRLNKLEKSCLYEINMMGLIIDFDIEIILSFSFFVNTFNMIYYIPLKFTNNKN